MLRAMANFTMGRYKDASDDFEHPSLRNNVESYPWLGGIAAARGDWAGAYRLFEDTDPLFSTYSPKLAIRSESFSRGSSKPEDTLRSFTYVPFRAPTSSVRKKAESRKRIRA